MTGATLKNLILWRLNDVAELLGQINELQFCKNIHRHRLNQHNGFM